MCEWSTKKIGEIVDLILSNVDKHIESSEKQVLLCNYMDVYNNRYIKNGHKFSYGSVKPDEFEKYRLKINDVIITKDSETPDDIAVPSMVFDEFDDLVCGYHLAILRPNVNLVSSSFLMHVLQLNEVSRFFSRAAKGATRYGITKDAIMNTEIFMPDLVTEQERIADNLSTVDNTIEKTEALIEKYQKIKEGMMQDLFTRGIGEDGKLRPPYHKAPELYKETELGMLPKEWRIQKIDKSNVIIIDGDRGVNYPKDYELMNEGYCLFLNANNVTKKGFVFDRLNFITKNKDSKLSTGKLTLNDIVITTRGTVGNMAFYDSNIVYENVRINSGMIILRNEDKRLSSKFLYHSLKNFIFQPEYRRVVSGSAQPQLPIKDLRQFNILTPTKEEQNAICKRVENIERLIELEHRQLIKMQDLKQALMQDLLTGKVRVPA